MACDLLALLVGRDPLIGHSCRGVTRWFKKFCSDCKNSMISHDQKGARGVMVIVVGNGHGDTSSNPGRD